MARIMYGASLVLALASVGIVYGKLVEEDKFTAFKALSKEWAYRTDMVSPQGECRWKEPSGLAAEAEENPSWQPNTIPCDEKNWVHISGQCGITGRMSPINVDTVEANKHPHPTALATSLTMGNTKVTAPRPGRVPLKPCQQAMFITSKHTLEVKVLSGSLDKDLERHWGEEERLISCRKALKEDPYAMATHPNCLRRCAASSGGLATAPVDPFFPTPTKVGGNYPIEVGKSSGPLLHYSFHSPSEHTLDGAYFPIEMHLFHGQAVIAVFIGFEGNLQARCANPAYKLMGGIAFTDADIMLQTDCRRAEWFEAIVPQFGTVQQLEAQLKLHGEEKHFPIKYVTKHEQERPKTKGSETIDSRISTPIADDDLAEIQKFVDWSPGGVVNSTKPWLSIDPYASLVVPPARWFYYYLGSYTTPPCTLGVHWVINPNPIHVFDKDIASFRRLLTVNVQPNNPFHPAHSYLRFNDPIIAPTWHPTLASWSQTTDNSTHNSTHQWDLQLGANNRFPVDVLNGPSLPSAFARHLYVIGSPGDTGAEKLKYLDSSPFWASGLPKVLNGSIRFGSSSMWGESDSSGGSASGQSLGSMGSGSFGFYMALWKWIFLIVSCCCCCFLPCSVSMLKMAKARVLRGRSKDTDEEEATE